MRLQQLLLSFLVVFLLGMVLGSDEEIPLQETNSVTATNNDDAADKSAVTNGSESQAESQPAPLSESQESVQEKKSESVSSPSGSPEPSSHNENSTGKDLTDEQKEQIIALLNPEQADQLRAMEPQVREQMLRQSWEEIEYLQRMASEVRNEQSDNGASTGKEDIIVPSQNDAGSSDSGSLNVTEILAPVANASDNSIASESISEELQGSSSLKPVAEDSASVVSVKSSDDIAERSEKDAQTGITLSSNTTATSEQDVDSMSSATGVSSEEEPALLEPSDIFSDEEGEVKEPETAEEVQSEESGEDSVKRILQDMQICLVTAILGPKTFVCRASGDGLNVTVGNLNVTDEVGSQENLTQLISGKMVLVKSMMFKAGNEKVLTGEVYSTEGVHIGHQLVQRNVAEFTFEYEHSIEDILSAKSSKDKEQFYSELADTLDALRKKQLANDSQEQTRSA